MLCLNDKYYCPNGALRTQLHLLSCLNTQRCRPAALCSRHWWRKRLHERKPPRARSWDGNSGRILFTQPCTNVTRNHLHVAGGIHISCKATKLPKRIVSWGDCTVLVGEPELSTNHKSHNIILKQHICSCISN